MLSLIGAENKSSYPCFVLDTARPSDEGQEVDEKLREVKGIVLDGVIDNIMRKYGAKIVTHTLIRTGGEKLSEDLDVAEATGDEVAVMGATREDPAMTKDLAGEIGTEIFERWTSISGALPAFCSTVHYVPLDIARAS